jgi:putative ribosome biogenesis GTPase RsgA
MRKIFDGREVANGVIFIKSGKDFNTVVDVAKRIGKECRNRGLNVDYWFLDASEETMIEREVIKQFLYEMEEENIKFVVVRTLKDISDDELERQAFLEVMIDCGVGVYLFDEGCFATVNYECGC